MEERKENIPPPLQFCFNYFITVIDFPSAHPRMKHLWRYFLVATHQLKHWTRSIFQLNLSNIVTGSYTNLRCYEGGLGGHSRAIGGVVSFVKWIDLYRKLKINTHATMLRLIRANAQRLFARDRLFRGYNVAVPWHTLWHSLYPGLPITVVTICPRLL